MPSAPIDVGITGSVTGGDNFTATITMDGQVTSDTTINLSTSSAVVQGPNGTPFPATAVVLSGHSSVAVQLGTTNPPANTQVTLTASANGGSASANLGVLNKPND